MYCPNRRLLRLLYIIISDRFAIPSRGHPNLPTNVMEVVRGRTRSPLHWSSVGFSSPYSGPGLLDVFRSQATGDGPTGSLCRTAHSTRRRRIGLPATPPSLLRPPATGTLTVLSPSFGPCSSRRKINRCGPTYIGLEGSPATLLLSLTRATPNMYKCDS